MCNLDWPFTPDGRFLEEISNRSADKMPENILSRYAAELKQTAIYLGGGTEDGLLPVAQRFHQLLTEAGISHTYEEYAGGHGDEAGKRHRKGLRFLAEVLEGGAKKR